MPRQEAAGKHRDVTLYLIQHLNNVRLSVKWLDPTCRHFIKLSVAGVHLEYYRASAQTKRRRNSGASQPAKSESGKRTLCLVIIEIFIVI